MTRIHDTARRIWAAVRGRKRRALPEVIVHDPKAAGPRDLDDVFHDPAIHSRVGSLIAETAAKKPAGKEGADPARTESSRAPKRGG